jgi:two-component system invasion response regulator UvrY
MLARSMSAIASNGQIEQAVAVAHGSRPVRVLVADDHAVFRTSVVRALGVVPDLEVAGVAESGELACQAVLTLAPDVVLIDMSMPGMSGLDATRWIRRESPATRVVLLTAFDGPAIQQAALAAGASGVVTKGAPLDDVVGVILEAASRRA